MEKYWVRNEGNRGLIVFSLGWACDNKVVDHIRPPGYDILCLFDWRSMDPCGVMDEIMTGGYEHRFLFAWSFGVWAAEQVLPDLLFDSAIALNGTPLPIDDQYGIEPRRIDVTIKGLQTGGMEQFERKAYGPFYEDMKPYLSPRSLGDNIIELERLRDNVREAGHPVRKWNRAIVGTGDEIFSPDNMLRYWGGKSQILPLPHFPFADPNIVLREV